MTLKVKTMKIINKIARRRQLIEKLDESNASEDYEEQNENEKRKRK